MTNTIKIIDAFKVNNAPFMMQETMYGERKVYLSEAYTEEFMIRSTTTNHLCRYVVKTEEKTISAYQYFGIRPTKNQKDNLTKLLTKMTKEQRADWYKEIVSERFNSENEACDFLASFNCSTFYHSNLELYVLATNNTFFNEAIWVLTK